MEARHAAPAEIWQAVPGNPHDPDFSPDCPLANFYKFEAIPERFL